MDKLSETNAYHEAGPAFMAVYVGARVRAVTLDPDWDDGPQRYADIQVEWPAGHFSRRQFLEKSVQVPLAGPVAEMLHQAETRHPASVAEWSADWQAAWQTAAELHAATDRRMQYLEQTTSELYHLLNQPTCWSALAALVDHLLAHEFLEGDEVTDIVHQWL